MSKTVDDNAPLVGANSPFFRIIKEGLDGLVDGEDYYDLLAEDVVFEYVITVPGYPRRVEGRQGIINLYSNYGDYVKLHSADNLHVHRDPATSVVVLENTKCTARRSRRDGLRQPLRLRRDHQGPQGDALARLPGPHRRIRRTRMAARPPLVTASASAEAAITKTTSFLAKALNARAPSHARVG
ncbi:hypothetical protein [Streptomyces sp. NPDC004008]